MNPRIFKNSKVIKPLRFPYLCASSICSKKILPNRTQTQSSIGSRVVALAPVKCSRRPRLPHKGTLIMTNLICWGSFGCGSSGTTEKVGTCAESISAAELAETTKLVDEVVKASRTESAIGPTVINFVSSISEGLDAYFKGEGEVAAPVSFAQSNGSYTLTFSGDRTLSLSLALYYPASHSKANTKITDPLFEISSYLVDPGVARANDKVTITFSSLGPLSDLIALPSTTTSPYTVDEDTFADSLATALGEIQIQITMVVKVSGEDSRSVITSRKTAKTTLKKFISSPGLDFDSSEVSGSWPSRGQTLSVDSWGLEPSVLGFGATGKIEVTITGDSSLGTFKSDIEYGSFGIPGATPTTTIRCEDGSLAGPSDLPAASFFASFFSGFNIDAKAQWKEVSDKYQGSLITCDDPNKLESCIIDAVRQHASGDKPQLDLAFLLDVSGSMWDEIDIVKTRAKAIAAAIASKAGSTDSQFGLVVYSDSVDAYTTKVISAFSEADSFATAVDQIELLGGGDYPEAALEGAMTAMNDLAWRSSADLRLIIAVSDAAYKDPGPEGVTLETVFNTAVDKSILIAPILMGY